MNSQKIYLSSSVTFEPEKACLSSQTYGDIHLTPNERRLLELIIRGQCKKETVFEAIWHSQGTIVSEASYHQLIKMLRRKLQHAGLPSSIIKTIPRYGIVLEPYELPTEVTDEEAAVNADVCITDEPAESSETEKEALSQLFNHFPYRLLTGICAALVILPPLLTPLLMENPPAFQERVFIDGVTFHFSPKRSVDRAVLVQKRRSLPKGVNNVYIASNGPKVFVAQCEGELSKEGKCSYEYYSSY